MCWANTNAPQARSLQGATGLTFLGRTSDSPAGNANTGCDYGPWSAQMLMRSPASGLTATWGVPGPVSSWASQSYAHRIYIR